jgi:hypothetical protein
MALSYGRRKIFNALYAHLHEEYPLPEGASVSMRYETYFKSPTGDLSSSLQGCYTHNWNNNSGRIRINLQDTDVVLFDDLMMLRALMRTIVHEYKHALQGFGGDDGEVSNLEFHAFSICQNRLCIRLQCN